jgi:hypothetical protein
VGTGSIEIGVGTLVARNEGIDAIVAQIDSLKQWIKQTQPNFISLRMKHPG